MKKVLIGGIAGGIVLFVWGAFAWTVLPLHRPSLHTIPNEDAMISVLKTNLDTKAVYLFPALPDQNGNRAAEQAQKMQQGPVGMIVYDPQGMAPMMTSRFVNGLILNFAAALLAAWFLSRSTARGSPYLSRVMFCGVLGIFASFVSFLPAWNWLGYPLDYTTAMVADAVVGWLITGLVIAAIVKTPAMAPA